MVQCGGSENVVRSAQILLYVSIGFDNELGMECVRKTVIKDGFRICGMTA